MKEESRTRSIAKTAVYRMTAIALLAALSFYYTGNAGEATTITILFNVGGSVVYYALERLWDSVAWGKLPGKDAKPGEMKVDVIGKPSHDQRPTYDREPPQSREVREPSSETHT